MNAELTMDFAGQSRNAVHLPHRPGMGAEREILAEVHEALDTGRLDLPALPGMALRVRNLIDDPNVSSDKIVNLLSSDPAISASVVSAAGGVALSRGRPVSNLRDAISRLGYGMLRSLVLNIAMTRLFQARSPFVDQQLKALWEHSREVAANSYVLAQRQEHLSPEQAMLAGLVHDIGALPLYLYADRHHSRLDPATMEELIRRFSSAIGARLLRSWNFPEELAQAAASHGNLQRTDGPGLADYADVVTMANLQMPGTAKFVAWDNVPAAERLGYRPADCRDFLSAHSEQLAAVRGMLKAGAR